MNSCSGDRRTLFTVSGPGITSTSNLYGYLFTPYTNRKTLTGTGTSFINNVPFSRNTLFLGSKSIYDNVEAIEVSKAINDTKLMLNTLPYQNYGSNINYAILKNVVLYLDASEKKSYPGTGNIWYDLSGYNNNFKCKGYVDWDKTGYFTSFSKHDYFVPDGSYNLAKSFPFYNDNFTVFMIIRNQTANNGYSLTANPVMLYYGANTQLYGYFGRGTELSYECNGRYYYTSDTWQSTYSAQRFYVENFDENTVLTFSYSNTSNATTVYGYERFRMYKDGVKMLLTSRQTATLETLFGFFSIGNYANNEVQPFMDGRIYALMVINRTMSDPEVLEMSNYFRDKFNF
jgi:hypothetical protein